MAVASHTSELVVVKECPRWAVCVARHAAQQRVWIQHKSLLTLGALVCLWARAAAAGLMALCNPEQELLTKPKRLNPTSKRNVFKRFRSWHFNVRHIFNVHLRFSSHIAESFLDPGRLFN